MDRRGSSDRSRREEIFWNCCLALVPVLYICMMTLGVCFLCRYGLYIQDDPLFGSEVHTPGRISKYYIVEAALYYVPLALALLFPLRGGQEHLFDEPEVYTVEDWRFSTEKLLLLGLSFVGAFLICKTRFYILWDEQIADRCRAVLLFGGAALAALGHIVIRAAIWRKAESELRFSYTAAAVCESMEKVCYLVTVLGAILFFLLIPAERTVL